MSHNAITAHYCGTAGQPVQVGARNLSAARFQKLRQLLNETLLDYDRMAHGDATWITTLRGQLDVIAVAAQHRPLNAIETATVQNNVYWLQSRGHLQPDDLNGMQFIEVQL